MSAIEEARGQLDAAKDAGERATVWVRKRDELAKKALPKGAVLVVWRKGKRVRVIVSYVFRGCLMAKTITTGFTDVVGLHNVLSLESLPTESDGR